MNNTYRCIHQLRHVTVKHTRLEKREGHAVEQLSVGVVFERQPASSAANGGSDAMKKEASKVRGGVLKLCCNGFFARVARSHKLL